MNGTGLSLPLACTGETLGCDGSECVGSGLFFFSSRRRHTRFDCDWISDVCSSELSVPQAYAAAVQPGLKATLEFADRPTARYEASVASTAHALDAISRTLQVELQIDRKSVV